LGQGAIQLFDNGPAMRVLAFTKYGATAASTRQRLLQYLPALHDAGIDVEYHALLNDDYVQSLQTGVKPKMGQVAKAYLARMAQAVSTRKYDAIWVYAELFPYLPASFEQLAFLTGKPVIYDFDDAFFHQYDGSTALGSLLKGKLEPLLRGAAICCCGNSYLQEYADHFCRRTIIIPTVVDTECYRPDRARPAGRPTVIGWIGSPSTWCYVRPMLPMLRSLVNDYPVEVRIIGGGVAATDELALYSGFRSVSWNEDSQVREIQAMDIGIMPLPDENWAKGKSGFKLIQYMACGLPVVASPVGVNREIVNHGQNGFLATTSHEWAAALRKLLTDADLRARLGAAGRKSAEEDYSLRSHAPRLIEMFRSAVRPV
jgi:glycosyltransferase involved in cell wall biosynthesis